MQQQKKRKLSLKNVHHPQWTGVFVLPSNYAAPLHLWDPWVKTQCQQKSLRVQSGLWHMNIDKEKDRRGYISAALFFKLTLFSVGLPVWEPGVFQNLRTNTGGFHLAKTWLFNLQVNQIFCSYCRNTYRNLKELGLDPHWLIPEGSSTVFHQQQRIYSILFPCQHISFMSPPARCFR